MKFLFLTRRVALVIVLAVLWQLPVSAQRATDEFVPASQYYGIGSWIADSLGNHRVVIRVTTNGEAVRARIPWRRRDRRPEEKNVIIIDATTEKRITNVHWLELSREVGDVVFEPLTVPGEYYVYYLIYRSRGSRNYPKGYYQPMERTADNLWLERLGLDSQPISTGRINRLPRAELIQFQSIDEFNSFYPMEVIATSREVVSLLKAYPDSEYLLFPEDREHPIKMTADLPSRWIQSGPKTTFEGNAEKGEFYSLQIGVYAIRSGIADIDVRMSNLRSRSGVHIPASAFTCFNTEGIDWKGNKLDPVGAVEKGKVGPLWMGVMVPVDVPAGTYEGDITVAPRGMNARKIHLIVNVMESVAADAGDNEPSRLTRLRWLNSQIAVDDDIVPPFTPMSVEGNVVRCLGRDISLNRAGFPEEITSYFSPEVTRLDARGRELLANPIQLVIETERGGKIPWKSNRFVVTKNKPGAIGWRSDSKVGNFDVTLNAQAEFDGFVDVQVTLTAQRETSVNDIRLEISISKDVAKYSMGLGLKGGYRPERFDWKWDKQFNHDAFWIGDVNAGLQVSFRDENYSRPLNTNFYQLKPLNMPPSWYNEGKGGFRFDSSEPQSIVLRAFSGPRQVKSGERLHFYFALLLTPFKLVDADAQWTTRYYHRFRPLDEIARTGANTINVHHATEINPFINYPFFRPAEMKAYIDEAHAKGFKVKIYYTVRELANRAPELFALRSLGDEVLSYGPGGGFSWLQEHLDSNYIAAWFVPDLKDAAVINSGVSRWHNYYVEGLNWLVKNVGIDGLYIDDVAFDRTTMKRVRKVLDRGRPGALIDLHSANQYNPRDGYVNSANLYLEHFPYINRLWFGEYFDYNSSPDFWLIEVSGIPFGLMGEMLEKGGNPWRGMIYGMTSRLPWAGDPTAIWKLWDSFGMVGSKMFGYWSPNCPVKTDNRDVLATAYVKQGKALISLASWAPQAVECKVTIDWQSLGLDPTKATMYAPEVKDFQTEREFRSDEGIPVGPGKGWLLILRANR